MSKKVYSTSLDYEAQMRIESLHEAFIKIRRKKGYYGKWSKSETLRKVIELGIPMCLQGLYEGNVERT